MMEPKFELQKLQHSDKQKIGKHLIGDALCYHFYYIVTQEKKVQSMIFFISQLLGHIF